MVGCLRCGGRARVGARFCGTCGGALGSARVGVRKTVTVLFADTPALTSVEGDVEAGARAAAAFYDCLRDVLEQHGGTVERHAGDAVMAVFGVPTARDDDARRAAAAALALRRAVHALPGLPELSVGVNTGEVLTGDGSAEQDLAVGDAVVVAARLQQHACPGEVLLGPATVRLLGPGSRLGVARELAVKGRVGDLYATPLVALHAPAPVAVGGAFVGRPAELEMLLAVLDRTVVSGLVQLVTILGEAGTGKSRLVHEALRERAGELTVLRGTCRGYGERSTWSALAELLHEDTGEPLGESPKRVLGVLQERRPELAGVLPVLASLLGDGDTPVGEAELSWAFARALAVVAEHGPVAVVLEDFHQADRALLDLLPEVVRRLEGSPVVFVVTARPDLLERRTTWGAGLRHVFGMTLRPLDVDSSRRLAVQLLPDDPAGVAAIAAPAGGNPLFLEQLAQAHVEGTGVAAPSVSAVLASRLDRLPPETRQVLERAAVVGAWGRVSDLRPLCEGEHEIDLDAELRSLAGRDLLELRDDTWAFGSELVRETAAAGLTREDRAELHQVRGTVLATRGANAAAGYHLEQASALLRAAAPERSALLAKQAAARLAAAGLRALTGDLMAAADLLTRAIALLAPDSPQRLSLLPELARAHQLSGDLVGADLVLEEAVSRAAEQGVPETAAHIELARLDLLRSTDPERASLELPMLLDRVLPVLERARDDRGLSLGWYLRASAVQYRVRWAAMEEPLEKALYHAHRSGDRRLIESAQSLQATGLCHGPMHLKEVRERLEVMLELPGTSPSHRAAIESRLAMTLALQGDPVGARLGLEQVRQVLRGLGRELSAVGVAVFSGPVELLAGEPARAAAELSEACDALTMMGERSLTSRMAGLLAEAHWRCGDPAKAAGAVEIARSMAGVGDLVSQVRWRSVQAKVLAGGGDAEAALQLSVEAVLLVAATDEVLTQGEVLADAAEVHELLGNTAASQVLLRDAVERFERKGATQSVEQIRRRLPQQAPA